jgi:hypothetical protein
MMGMSRFSKVGSHNFLRRYLSYTIAVPSIPASRTSGSRLRVEETPTHTGGLTEAGRKKLEEHKRNREKQRGRFCLPKIYGLR